MSHGSLGVIALHKTGMADLGVDYAGNVIGVTTVANGPALLVEYNGTKTGGVQMRRYYVLDLGLAEEKESPDDCDFLGVATTGNRCWAVYRWSYAI